MFINRQIKKDVIYNTSTHTYTHTHNGILLLLLLSHFSRVPTLCNPIDGSPPGSPVPGILQARTLERVAIFFSNAWKLNWSHSVVSDSSWLHGLQPTRLLHPWNLPGKSTGVGCHRLLHKLYPNLAQINVVTSCFPGSVLSHAGCIG